MSRARLDLAIGEISEGPHGAPYTTPSDVAILLVNLARIEDGNTILDPCCGVAHTLAEVVSDTKKRGQRVRCFGQEINPFCFALATLRSQFGSSETHIQLADTLRNPGTFGHNQLPTFDRVLCHPPFGIRLGDEELVRHDAYNHLSKSRSGRWSSESLFLQFALASLNPGGRAVIVVPPGFLFRGGSDARLRELLLKADVVRAVVSLPSGLASGSAVEMAVIVLENAKQDPFRNNVQFVDACTQPEEGHGTRLSDAFLESARGLLDSAPNAAGAVSQSVPCLDVIAAGGILQPRNYIKSETRHRRESVISRLSRVRQLEFAANSKAADLDRLIANWRAENPDSTHESAD